MEINEQQYFLNLSRFALKQKLLFINSYITLFSNTRDNKINYQVGSQLSILTVSTHFLGTVYIVFSTLSDGLLEIIIKLITRNYSPNAV